MTLGDVIASYRHAHHMTMEKFSELSGISKGYISMLEKNRTHRGEEPSPSLSIYRNAAKAIGVKTDVLIRMVDGNIRLEPGLPSVKPASDVVSFRVHADIATGYNQPPVPPSDWEGVSLEIPRSALCGRSEENYFVIRITGDSMYPHYQNGDYVLVLRQPVLDYNGQVAVLLCGKEGTIKKVEYQTEQEEIHLLPLNPEYQPHIIRGAALEQCRIIGIPQQLIRNYR